MPVTASFILWVFLANGNIVKHEFPDPASCAVNRDAINQRSAEIRAKACAIGADIAICLPGEAAAIGISTKVYEHSEMEPSQNDYEIKGFYKPFPLLP